MSRKTLSTGMFYMWRCIVAIGHADGRLGKEELDHFEKLFDNLLRYFDMTQEQRDTFADDLYTVQDVDDLFRHINDPEARDMLVGFAEELAWIDGELDPGEEAVLERLRLKNPERYDRKKLLEDIRSDIVRHKSEWEAERARMRERARGRNPYFHAADVILMRLGIDVLDW